MSIKIKKAFVALAITLFFSATAVAGGEIKPVNLGADLIADGLTRIAESIGYDEMSGYNKPAIKQGEPYDESKDPALHKSTPPEEGPKHGYFAVSLLVIAIVGVLLYFLKID